jgi:AmiR/NasT family two-component response regulator
MNADMFAVVDELEAAEQSNRHLIEALSTRTVIGQATGIIMERYKLGPDAAFAVLLRTSSESNRKVREIAEQLVSTGHAEGL